MPPQYKDLGDETEDERIRQIGTATMGEKAVVGFVVDKEEDDGIAERYITKLKERFPGIRVIYKADGPVADTTFVKVAPPLN